MTFSEITSFLQPDILYGVSFHKVLVHQVEDQRRGLLAIPMREQLESVLKYMLDENEFLSPYGIRSLSKVETVIKVKNFYT